MRRFSIALSLLALVASVAVSAPDAQAGHGGSHGKKPAPLPTVTVTPSQDVAVLGVDTVFFDVTGLAPGEWVQGVVRDPSGNVVAVTSPGSFNAGDANGEWWFAIYFGNPNATPGDYTNEVLTSTNGGASWALRASCVVTWAP